MKTYRRILCTLLAAGLGSAAPVSAQSDLASDDFSVGTRGSDGDTLDSTNVQFSSSGTPAYNSPNGLINTGRFHERSTGNWLAVPNYQNEDQQGNPSPPPNQANGFVVNDMPSSNTVRFETTMFPTTSFNGNLKGMWIGFTNGNSGNLQNNIGTATEHVSARFLPPGAGAQGQVNVQTYDGNGQNDTFSSIDSEASADASDEYQMTLDYNFDTGEASATITNVTDNVSNTASVTIASGLALTDAQFDITGYDNGNGLASDDPGFSSMTVSAVPEPSAYALVGGAFAFGLVIARRAPQAKRG